MKFTYTHITKNYTEITEYKVNKNNKIKSKIMYETLEHWKQYKQEQNKLQQAKQLFEECGFQYKEKAKQEMSKFINQLVAKNGTTKY